MKLLGELVVVLHHTEKGASLKMICYISYAEMNERLLTVIRKKTLQCKDERIRTKWIQEKEFPAIDA